MIEAILLRVLVQFLVFMNDYEGVELTDQETLRQYEAVTALLDELPAVERVEFHERLTAVLGHLSDHEREVAIDFLEGVELLDNDDS